MPTYNLTILTVQLCLKLITPVNNSFINDSQQTIKFFTLWTDY